MLPEADTYEDLVRKFNWCVPKHFNFGVAVCDNWAEREPNRTAIEYCTEESLIESLTFEDLRKRSNQLANTLTSLGARKGDRIGILLPQRPETAYSHIAIHKIGAISVPMFTLFETDALAFRLNNSGARFLITDKDGAAKVARLKENLDSMETVFSVDGPDSDSKDFHEHLSEQSEEFEPVATLANDPAFLSYTSGTTGPPKGALHAHRVLLGHLPCVEFSHDFFPQPNDKMWTPADWAWMGGFMNVLMPSLYHGIPVVACRFKKFNGEAAFKLLAERKIRNSFIPPTALKMMRQVENPKRFGNYSLRTIASGGEALGTELVDWGRKTFGITINEIYGQTECNLIISSCNKIMKTEQGFMGRSVPGHTVSIVDDNGNQLPFGTQGNIAVKRPDPVMFLEYWKNPQATEEKFAGEWMLTGDTGICNKEGWYKFVGRDDDVISSSGYRIGPGEIEDCLLKHPKIAMVGVIGKPDPIRNEIVKAYIVLKKNEIPSESLSEDIQNFVKNQLAAYEYPREIEFVDSLPMTTTGKIIRGKLREKACKELEKVSTD